MQTAIGQRNTALGFISGSAWWVNSKAIDDLDSWGAVNHRIFHIYADKKTFLINRLEFASKEIELECIRLVQEASYECFNQIAFAKNPLTNAVTGKFFEKYCHDIIPQGGSFSMRSLDIPIESDKLPPFFKSWGDKADEYIAEIPKMITTEFDANPPAGSLPLSPKEGHYYIPSQSNFKSADSLCLPNIMFQMTLEKGKKTPSPNNTTELLKTEKLDVIYCVPDWNFTGFKASFTEETKGKTRVLNTSPQRKYCMDIKPSIRKYHTACRRALKIAR